MDLEKVIRELEAERDELRIAIDAIERLAELRRNGAGRQSRQPPKPDKPDAGKANE